jgi:predicted metal-binding membrane protein
MASRALARRDTVPLGVVAVIALAWSAAIGAEVSGHAGALHHDALIEGNLPPLVALGVFVAAWQLMIAAMMLPSALPMGRLHATAASAYPEPGKARAAFVAGYGAVWTAFGAAAFIGDTGIHRTVDSTPWLAQRPWLVAGSLLVVAGLAQFLPLTQACLRSCRHPFAFMLDRFRPGVRGAFQTGRDHGLYCLGCCWGLMLVMFAAGVANLAWMATLTVLMTYEKVGRRGQQIVPAIGSALMVWGALVVAHVQWLPHALSGPR